LQLEVSIKRSSFLIHSWISLALVELFYQPIGLSVFIRSLHTQA